MSTDHDAREAAARALGPELADTYDCTRVWEAWGYETMSQDDFEPAGLRCEEIANAAIDAYLAALSAQRQDHTELIAELRSEANIADRPGQFDRLNAIADALEAERQ